LVSVPSVTVRISVNGAEQAMAEHVVEFEVLGPWSLDTSRRFWEGFTPAAPAGEPGGPGLRTAVMVGCRQVTAPVPDYGKD
jgi:DNA-3-methyladenine glycosylase II